MSWILVIQILILWFSFVMGIIAIFSPKKEPNTIVNVKNFDYDTAEKFKANMEKIQKAARSVGE